MMASSSLLADALLEPPLVDTVDTLMECVRRDGKDARNLVNWSVSPAVVESDLVDNTEWTVCQNKRVQRRQSSVQSKQASSQQARALRMKTSYPIVQNTNTTVITTAPPVSQQVKRTTSHATTTLGRSYAEALSRNGSHLTLPGSNSSNLIEPKSSKTSPPFEPFEPLSMPVFAMPTSSSVEFLLQNMDRTFNELYRLASHDPVLMKRLLNTCLAMVEHTRTVAHPSTCQDTEMDIEMTSLETFDDKTLATPEPGTQSTPLASPRRLMKWNSPRRQGTASIEQAVALKQQKADAQRTRLQSEKTEKLRHATDKIKTVHARHFEHRANLQKQFEEKMEKADKKRETIMKEKMKSQERSKTPTVPVSATPVTPDLRSQKRHETSEIRLQEFEGERRRKLEEHAAKEEAALVRRKALEAERAAKLLHLQHKEQALAAQRQQRTEEERKQRQAQQLEKEARLKQFLSEQEQGTQEKKQALDQKLAKSVLLHDAHIEERKKKMAAVTMKVLQLNRSQSPEKGVPLPAVECVQESISLPLPVRDKTQKRHLKRVKQKFLDQSTFTAPLQKLAWSNEETLLEQLPTLLEQASINKSHLAATALPVLMNRLVQRQHDKAILSLNQAHHYTNLIITLIEIDSQNTLLLDASFPLFQLIDFLVMVVPQLDRHQNLLSLVGQWLQILCSGLKAFKSDLVFDYLESVKLLEMVLKVPLVVGSTEEASLLAFACESMHLLSIFMDASSNPCPLFYEQNGLVLILDALMLCLGPSRAVPAQLVSDRVLNLSYFATRTLNRLALKDLVGLQKALEGLQNEFFHLATFWLRYCTSLMHKTLVPLLHEWIRLIGHVCLGHKSHQSLLRLGTFPVLLQLLTQLPFAYFSEHDYMKVLIPTLLAACFKEPDNTRIVAEEIHVMILGKYVEEVRASGPSPWHDEVTQCFPEEWWDEAISWFK